uniref:CBF1-interacting co-repressor CIR N-terminal domain-containing protein n=1 Tax=Chenopodium quinoa TaxID=63459 RepID=A0A803N3S9_CHEQI
MGGHGGLNILPQKKWNVYNFDNREKVRKDEEAAAKDDQLKRDQSRKRDSEFRLLQLRRARGVDPHPTNLKSEPPICADEPKSESDSKHLNLLGYGVAGKGVKAPWYTLKPDKEVEEKRKETNGKMMKKTKKTVEELREERLNREKAEKERERALLLNKTPSNHHYPRDRFMRQR